MKYLQGAKKRYGMACDIVGKTSCDIWKCWKYIGMCYIRNKLVIYALVQSSRINYVKKLFTLFKPVQKEGGCSPTDDVIAA